MTTYSAVDASQFPVYQSGSGSALWWGTAGLVAIEATVYAALIASYFYLRQGESGWPPGNIAVPAVLWPTVGLVLRLLSEPCTLMASRSAQRGNNAGILLWLGAALVLMIAWMVQVLEYMFGLPYDWTLGTYGSIEWLMVAWAFCCTASAVIWGLVNWAWAAQGHFTPQRRTGLMALRMYWSLQLVGWIFFWLVIYFGPRVFQRP